MRGNPFLIQRRTPLSSDSDMLCQQIMHTVRAEPGSSGIGEDNLAIAAHGLLEPELQSTCCLLGQRRASVLAPLAEAMYMRTGSQRYILAAQAGYLRKPQASLNRDLVSIPENYLPVNVAFPFPRTLHSTGPRLGLSRCP
jgi:hypothetical protein